jgi:hypothetical protein
LTMRPSARTGVFLDVYLAGTPQEVAPEALPPAREVAVRAAPAAGAVALGGYAWRASDQYRALIRERNHKTD